MLVALADSTCRQIESGQSPRYPAASAHVALLPSWADYSLGGAEESSLLSTPGELRADESTAQGGRIG
jgi:hypothetical protein